MTRWLRGLLQLTVVVLAVLAVHAWQTRNMLPGDERVAAPPFELADAAGVPVASAALTGRPTVLYFFAPWCQVCAASAGQLRWFGGWSGDSVQVVLVALEYSSPAEVAAWTARHQINMPVLLGDPAVAGAYRIGGYPTYYVLDREGRVAARDLGLTTLFGLWWRTRGLAS